MTKKRIIAMIIAVAIVLLLIVLIIFIVYNNKAVKLTCYTITSDKLPKEFSGYKIAQVSDLHNTEIGNNNKKLLELLADANPDIIAITGDLIYSRKPKPEIALQFAKNALKIAPCYYVAGNHEARLLEYDDFKNSLTELGVIVLDDERIKLKQSQAEITLVGLKDPSFETDYINGDSVGVIKPKLEKLADNKNDFTVLLSHRPELFEVYTNYNIDLVLSGHVHGGQIRIPFVGGLYGPNQGFFPEYDSGLYSSNNTNMIVSRGIGKSIIPLRINNNPEVVLIELNSL